MVSEIVYSEFLKVLDKDLATYFKTHKDFVYCKKGCSLCCEQGDYPVSELELQHLMRGYINLPEDLKLKVQENKKNLTKGGACPFLINSICSIYNYRPIICRTHGLAYLTSKGIVKLPHCTNLGKNYSTVYKNNQFFIEPIKKNLEQQNLLSEFDFGEIRNLYDWMKTC